jgi:hypothetical protein
MLISKLIYELKCRAIMRWIYEVGYCGDDMLSVIFMPKNKKKKDQIAGQKEEDKEAVINQYESARRTQVRAYMARLEAEKYIDKIVIEKGKGNKQHIYMLTVKGYHLVSNDMAGMKEGYVNTHKMKGVKNEMVVIPKYDQSVYRRIGVLNINLAEKNHHDYLVSLKYVIIAVLKQAVTMPDYLDKKDQLYSNDRPDLVIKKTDGKHIAIEYERSIKNESKYLGYVYDRGGVKKTYTGIIKLRQHDDKIKAVIVICDTDNIYEYYMKMIQKVMTPDAKSGKYTIIDKFYLISREKYNKISEMLNNGAFIYCKKTVKENTADYITKTFREIIL